MSDIQVVARPPYIAPRGSRLSLPIRVASSLHVTTNPIVIRRWVLLPVGKPCDERRRAESERILRTQPYIAEASVRAVADTGGTVFILVETTDEYTPVLATGGSSASPLLRLLRVGEGNIAGDATYAAAEWRHGDLRDSYGVHVLNYQLFGRPYLFDASAYRGDEGKSSYSILATHPLYTDLQRVAWLLTTSDLNYLYGFARPDSGAVLLGQERQFTNVGAVVRIGEPGQLSLFGLSFSQEEVLPRIPPVRDTLPDSLLYAELFQRYPRHRSARVNALWAVRNLGFSRVSHFDALSGTQDLGTGFQFGTLLGRSLRLLGPTDDDILVAGELYAGAGNERHFLRVEARGEGRYQFNTDGWDGIVGSTRLTAYQRVGLRNTLVADVQAAGGWRTRVPFQLRLGQVDAGVRGFAASPAGGSQRAVIRLEDRWFGGRIGDQAEFGLAAFADAGRVWAGDLPAGLGVTTPIEVGTGVALLVAFPPGSQRVWRLEAAVPASAGQRGRFQIRFGNVRVFQLNSPEPPDVRAGREQAVPRTAFNFP